MQVQTINITNYKSEKEHAFPANPPPPPHTHTHRVGVRGPIQMRTDP